MGVQGWKVQVGRTPLYLLDTNLESNADADRSITYQLYAPGVEMRIRQELVLGIGGSGSGGSGVGSASPDTLDSTASLVLSLPVDRKSERNAYRSSMISLGRAMRDHDLLLDTVERDVRDQLRVLRAAEQDIELQRQQIEQDQRAVAISKIRVEAGEADNRELIR